MEEEYKPPTIETTYDNKTKLIMERRRIWDNKKSEKSENLENVFFPSLSEVKVVEKSNPWANFNKNTLN